MRFNLFFIAALFLFVQAAITTAANSQFKAICDCNMRDKGDDNVECNKLKSTSSNYKEIIGDIFELIEQEEFGLLRKLLLASESEPQASDDDHLIRCGDGVVKILNARVTSDRKICERKCSSSSIKWPAVSQKCSDDEKKIDKLQLISKKCDGQTVCNVTFDDNADLNQICKCSPCRLLNIEFTCTKNEEQLRSERVRRNSSAQKNRMASFARLLHAGIYPFRVPGYYEPDIYMAILDQQQPSAHVDYYQADEVGPFIPGWDEY